MAELLTGAGTAETLTRALTLRSENLRARKIIPCLVIVRVGNRADSLSYERGARRRCKTAKILVRSVVLPDSVTREQFITTIQTLNNDLSVHGVLVLQPLPRQLDSADIRQNLLSIKDVDGVTEGSLAAVYSGGGTGFAPCTAAACLALLKSYRIALAGKRAVVLGRSLVVGRPLSMLLMRENATVTVCHSGSQNLPEICQEADLIVAAAGQAGLIGAECLRAGQTVLDVGIHTRAGGGLCGDVRFEEAEPIVRAITPVPGGVGAVTTAILASHVIEAAERVKRS